MAIVNAYGTLTGLFKEQYGDKVIDLNVSSSIIQRLVRFEEKESVGNLYHQPVDVALEAGFSYAGPGQTPGITAGVTFVAPNTGQMQDAALAGSQILGRAQVDYEALYRAAANNDRKAFIGASAHVVKRLARAATKRVDIALLHGQSGMATLSAVSGAGTTRTWTISDDSWSAGIWAGTEGHTLDVYSSVLAKRNTNANVIITGVTVASKQLAVSGNSTDLTAIVATDLLFWEGASPTNEIIGLDKWLRNTGTLATINAATYSLWGGNVYSSSTGVPSLSKILDAISTPVSFGLEDNVVALVSPRAYEVINSDQAALREYDTSYSDKAKNGFNGVSFRCQAGTVDIVPHPYQKDGKIHIFCPKECVRIGATDLTFIRRHGTEESLILENAGSAGAEMRIYGNMNLLVTAPRHTVVLDGVTY